MIQAEKLAEADYRGDLAVTLDQRGNNDLLNLTRPDIIAAICQRFVDAGADLLATNTFNATSISQADYGPEAVALADEMNRASARIIRSVADAATAADGKPALGRRRDRPDQQDPVAVAHASTIRASAKSISTGSRPPIAQQVDALVEGGVDFILIETVFDTLNAKAAIMAAIEAGQALGRELPIMVSMTLTDLSGRNLSGHTVEAFWASVRHARPLTIGLNCSFGAAQLRPHLAALSTQAETLIMAYPNAGLPNDLGDYDEAARGNRAPGVRMGRRRAGQRRRRLLRHDPRPHRRHRQPKSPENRQERIADKPDADDARRPRAYGARSMTGNRRRRALRQHRGTDQRHRIGALQETGPGRRL